MKNITRFFIVAAALIMLCVSLVSCGSKSGVPDGMQLASADNVPYLLYVPKAWTLNTASGLSSAYYSMTGDMSNVTVTSYSTSSSETDTVDEYWTFCRTAYAEEFTDFTVIEEGAGVILGLTNAKQYVYTLKNGNETYKYMQVIAYHSDIFYTLTYTALEANYDAHLDDVSSIITNFSFR